MNLMTIQDWDILVIHDAYRNDIRFALQYVSKLAKFNKRIIISADHGERLGEHGRFGHGGNRDKVVIEVPLFEVKTE